MTHFLKELRGGLGGGTFFCKDGEGDEGKINEHFGFKLLIVVYSISRDMWLLSRLANAS